MTAVDRPARTRAQDRPGRPERPDAAAGRAEAGRAGTTTGTAPSKAAGTPATRRGPAGGSGGGTGADRTADRPARLPWVLAVLGLVGTLGFGLAWRAERGDAGGGSTATAQAGVQGEMLDAAEAFSKALTNFDGATIDRDFDRIVARSTGQFRSQADQFFSTEVRTQLKEAQASSRGEIRSAFVQSGDDERGTVFVVVDQTIANNQSPQPKADTLRMELGLVRRDGAWRVERVSVLTAPAGTGALGKTTGSGGTTTPSGGN